jgi:ech hydrogenase subunit F
MVRNILRNLVGPRATRLHPQVVRSPFENSRGELFNDMTACTLCGTCAVKCPSQCIQVDKKGALWRYDPFACVLCGVCSESCPSGSLRHRCEYMRPTEELMTVELRGGTRRASQKPSSVGG